MSAMGRKSPLIHWVRAAAFSITDPREILVGGNPRPVTAFQRQGNNLFLSHKRYDAAIKREAIYFMFGKQSGIFLKFIAPVFSLAALLSGCGSIPSVPMVAEQAERLWVDDNYYQIINGTLDAVSDGYAKDRGYTVYFNFGGNRFLLDTGYWILDTGDSETSFVGNLKTAGVNSDDLDFVVLSSSGSRLI